jgi:hypothetical protein
MISTALPERTQEQFEQQLRDTIARISRTDDEVIESVPSQWEQDETLSVPFIPELNTIQVTRGYSEHTLQVLLHFSPDPRSEQEDNPGTELSSGQTVYLGDLRRPCAKLSDAVVKTLIRYCDAPRERPAEVFDTDRADFILDPTLSQSEYKTFRTTLWYPEYVAKVYAEGQAEVANRLRLPF